jgi:hypothetical protein
MRYKPSGLIGVACCAVLLAGFAVLSYTAVLRKSATADEPLHALGAYVHTFHGDFRLNSEDPPLWKYWAMVPHRRGAIRVDLESPQWKALPDYIWDGTKFVTQTLYRTPGNNPDRFINRSRVMMLMWGVALGALIAVWSWQIAGASAAIIASVIYCLDPNFLGHAPLVKDDVPLALALAGLVWAVWRAGRRLTIGRAAWVALFLALGLNVKFSGVLLVPITAALLVTRALLPDPWIVTGRQQVTRSARLLAVLVMLAGLAITSILGIWASYGFRFAPTRDPNLRLNMPLIRDSVTWSDLVARDPQHRAPRPEVLAARTPPLAASIAMWMNEHELLPQAWLSGFMDTYKTTMLGQSYLLGQINRTGVWYYFPATMLFKTPTITLVGVLLVVVVLGLALRSRASRAHLDHWALLCLVLPVLIYILAAIGSAMNLGLRHILAIYPLLFVLIAITLTRLWKQRAVKVILIILGAAHFAESIRAYPNYVAFFNTPSGGWRGGFRLLGDSNLDWGQDLLTLQRWRQQNPQERLYVCYFGMADAGYYLDSYTALPGHSSSPLSPQLPREPGVLAISATHLQGIYLDPATRAMYRALYEKHEPIQILGGTIYLYRFDDSVRRDLGIGVE